MPRTALDGSVLRDVEKEHLPGLIKKLSSVYFVEVLGFSIIAAHVHLLLRTGNIPVSTVMRRLPTSHAMSYNRFKKSLSLQSDRFGYCFMANTVAPFFTVIE